MDEVEQIRRDVATKIMGYRMYCYDKGIRNYYMLMNCWFVPLVLGKDGQRPTEEEAWADCPDFTGSADAALLVIEQLRTLGLCCTISAPSPGFQNWDVRGWNPETNGQRFIAHAETLPLAICKAALNAIPAESKEPMLWTR